ncbi:Adenylate kinase 2 [Hibiscus syriacus]|uniref:adenylate kinase n=1 Tax=Hibiscus syriacus TaxID=106335 RepID=A0A6A3CMC5_HIBSY|nr:Adenylate kinase 2 [Hibiscus syriacus]
MGSSTCLSPCISLSPSLSPHPKFPNLNPNPLLLSHPSFAPISLRSNQTPSRSKKLLSPNATNCFVAASAKGEPLKVIISGAPASGKGTQCELITRKYGLVHISAGDLLRAEIAAASENGKLAKEYMEKGQLVPNEIVVMMVKERLLQLDSQQRGWLLDGYPRSSSQAAALEDYGIRPDVFILLDVNGNMAKENVFEQIDAALTHVAEQRKVNSGSLAA